MIRRTFGPSSFVAAVVAVTILAVAPAGAEHSWGDFHWARASNPVALALGDNVSGTWDDHLVQAAADWDVSEALSLEVTRGKTKARHCRPTSGRVEVCSAKYGTNGWLGLASVWAGGDHITQATVKLNDTYFDSATYNTGAWRQMVMCQEIGHVFGLGHVNEDFGNANQNTCMDYTNAPESNQHPNGHDFEQLDAIYGHEDSPPAGGGGGRGRGKKGGDTPGREVAEWGRAIRFTEDGKPSLFVRDVGDGVQVFTFVLWAA